MSISNSSFWTDRSVLVTGCTGLLGSWLTEALLEEGASVVGLIRDGVVRSRLVQNHTLQRINVVSGAVEDYSLLERTLNEYQVQTVFHLAAQTIVRIANENPLSTFESNVRGTWNVLEACRRTAWVSEIVIASSDKAYGAHDDLPYSEDAPLLGNHPYDVSKACADLIAQAYAKSYELPVCITRFGNLFGAGDLNFDRLIPGTIRSVIRGEAPVIRSNGQFSRDYIYVEDAAHAYMAVAKGISSDPAVLGQAFNFSYEAPQTAVQVVGKILKQMGRPDLKPSILNTAQNEIPHQYLCASKAREWLGWQPKFDFDQGLSQTIPWYVGALGETATQ